MLIRLCNLLTVVPMAFFQAVLLEKLNIKFSSACDKTEAHPERKRIYAGTFLCFVLAALAEYLGGYSMILSICLEAIMMLVISSFVFARDRLANIKACVVVFSGTFLICLSSRLLLACIKTTMMPEQQIYVDKMLGLNMNNVLIYVLFIGWKIYSGRKNRQKFILISLISCLFAVGQTIFYYYLFLSNPSGLTDKIIAISTICSIVVLFVHGTMLELMEKIVENQHKQNEEEKKLLEKKYEYDYYLLAEEQAEAVRRIHEDMRTQLQAVQSLMEEQDEEKNKEAERILGKLEDEVNQFGRVYYCDDAVLNTILSLKQEKARKLGIEMDIRVDSVIQTGADDIDLCSVITNLLDNAIESAQKVKTENQKQESDEKLSEKIKVRVGQRGGYLVMKVDNPAISAPVKNKKGRYISSKKEKGTVREHGRGLNIVEKTVQKYGGYLDFKEENGRVVATAFLQDTKKGEQG